ncbi:MAG: hypothetical protein ABW019_06840 [Chitinophagaceae bacterium]
MKKGSFYLLLLAVLLIFSTCQPEDGFELSDVSVGSLKSTATGDCLPKTVGGVYRSGIALDSIANYIEVQAEVISPGRYLITTDTVNGVYFHTDSVFTSAGIHTVRLKGKGTPVAAGTSHYAVTYGSSHCSVQVDVLPPGSGTSAAVFTLKTTSTATCMNAVVSGTYTAGVPLNSSNQVAIDVDVTVPGTYYVATATVNGMNFTGLGTFTSAGPGVLILTAVGSAPTIPGVTTVPVHIYASTCSFEINVEGPATYTVDCSSPEMHGAYVMGTALNASNTVHLNVNVTTRGQYTVTTGTVNGMTFSETGIFYTTGPQTLNLAASGTPAAAGTFSIPVSSGITPCSFPVTVSGPANYTVNCGSAVVHGSYMAGTALGAGNTVDIQVTAATMGDYTITATVNGMTFSGSGTFSATGPQTITLAGSGTPAAAGTFNVAVSSGAAPCSFPVTVSGPAAYTVNCASAVVHGSYRKDVPLTVANTVDLQVNVAAPGDYAISKTVNGMTFSASGAFTTTGMQTITLAASGTPAAVGISGVSISSGTTPCTFMVRVDGPSLFYTVNCNTAAVHGTYAAGTALTAGNTVDVLINPAAMGDYTISGSVNGMTFSRSGTLADGPQTITLTGSGTPIAAGTFYVPIMAGSVPCSFPVTVTGTAAFTVNCASAVVNGTYRRAYPLGSSNTVTIGVNVTATGRYTLTGSADGMTFSGAGTFSATGPQTITLHGNGNPTAAGTFNVTLAGASNSCSFPVTVNVGTPGTWQFTAEGTTYSGYTNDAFHRVAGETELLTITGGPNSGTGSLFIELLSMIRWPMGPGSYFPGSQNRVISFSYSDGTVSYTNGNVIIIFTAFDLAAHTVQGTIGGTAKNAAGNAVPITNGTFNAYIP